MNENSEEKKLSKWNKAKYCHKTLKGVFYIQYLILNISKQFLM